MSFFLLLACVPAHAQAGQDGARARDETRMEWLAPAPCSLERASPMPGQPQLGLALFRFDCPGEPAKFATAKISRKMSGLVAAKDIAKGEALSADNFAADSSPRWISRIQDIPLSEDEARKDQAKLPLAAGAKLMARDFERRRLWIGGEAVMITLEQGNVTTTLPGAALGVGKLGEAASAKAETGKVFSGTTDLCDSLPCLRVKF